MHRVPKPQSIDKAPHHELKNPTLIVLARVFVRGGAPNPLSSHARLLACALGSRLRRTDQGHYATWAPITALIHDTGLSRRTIYRTIDELCEGEAPIFARSFPGSTRCDDQTFRHASPRYTLILAPIPFVKGRDTARADQTAVAQQDARRRLLDLQKRFIIGALSQADYDREKAALEFQQARHRRTARAARRSSP